MDAFQVYVNLHKLCVLHTVEELWFVVVLDALDIVQLLSAAEVSKVLGERKPWSRKSL